MKSLKIHSSYEPFNIEIGDTLIEAVIDLSDEGFDSLYKLVRDNQGRIKSIQERIENGGDTAKLKKQMSALLRDVVVTACGQETYDAIISACGAGRKMKPENCNIAMTHVFLVIMQSVAEHGQEMKNSKAAHYLQDVVINANEPTADTELHIV